MRSLHLVAAFALCAVVANAAYLRTAQEPKEAASNLPPIDKEGYSDDWGDEWHPGKEFPHWSDVHPKAEQYAKYTDYQSDGKRSPAGGEDTSVLGNTLPTLLQLSEEPKASSNLPPIDKDAYSDDWGDEWHPGKEYPHWSDVHPKAEQYAKYTDYQSDGKRSPAGGEDTSVLGNTLPSLLQTSEDPKTASQLPPIDKDGYSDDWGDEWHPGAEYPHWSDVHPKADQYAKYTDYQSDGKRSPAGGEDNSLLGNTLPSLLQTSEDPKSQSSQLPPIDKDGYSEDWGDEWHPGEQYPHWSEVHPKAEQYAKYTDYQSDGKRSPAGGEGNSVLPSAMHS